MRAAFDEWSSTGIPLSFAFVNDSAKADVHVTWIDRFDEQISGKTLWAHDDDWWIVEANIGAGDSSSAVASHWIAQPLGDRSSRSRAPDRARSHDGHRGHHDAKSSGETTL